MREMEILDWYEEVCRDESFVDIAMLIRVRGELSVLSAKLACDLKMHMASNRKEDVVNDINVGMDTTRISAQTDTSTNKPYTIAKAKGMAMEAHRDSLIRVAAEEGRIDGMKIVLKQYNEVLSAMNQHIAEMRQQLMRQ